MNNYSLSPKAKKSLHAIARKSDEMFGRDRTWQYLKTLKEQFTHIAQYPEKGRVRDELIEGVRSYPEGSHMIYYRVIDKRIEIIDILHQSMDPISHL